MRVDIDKDIEGLLVKYPTLEAWPGGGAPRVRGLLPLKDDFGGQLTSYRLLITYPPEFPHRFPRVREMGYRIPRVPDRHISPDGTLCLGPPVKEALRCQNEIGSLEFVESILIPYLFNQVLFEFEPEKAFAQGWYEHFGAGIKQSYEELFPNCEWQILRDVLCGFAVGRKLSANGSCFCGSGEKFRDCHSNSVEKLKIVGKETLRADIKSMKEYEKGVLFL